MLGERTVDRGEPQDNAVQPICGEGADGAKHAEHKNGKEHRLVSFPALIGEPLLCVSPRMACYSYGSKVGPAPSKVCMTAVAKIICEMV